MPGIEHLRDALKIPYLQLLVGATGATTLAGCAFMGRDLFRNPALDVNPDSRGADPYPWNKIKANQCLKLVVVNRKYFDSAPDQTYRVY
ncbi:hypothetical protein BC832DRAFT_590928 [Gaertneriomyces semiglobifer]|nr:hypothetical protein BC832DRAFT_590928 [Gaertneriomyces semiglobifer]